MAGGVKPAVRAEEHWVVEVLGVVGDSPGACVELGLYGGRKVLSQKHIPKRGPHLIIGTKISRKRAHTCGVGMGSVGNGRNLYPFRNPMLAHICT